MQTVIHHQVVEWLETNKKNLCGKLQLASSSTRKKIMLFNGNEDRLGLGEGGKTTQSLPPSWPAQCTLPCPPGWLYLIGTS